MSICPFQVIFLGREELKLLLYEGRNRFQQFKSSSKSIISVLHCLQMNFYLSQLSIVLSGVYQGISWRLHTRNIYLGKLTPIPR